MKVRALVDGEADLLNAAMLSILAEKPVAVIQGRKTGSSSKSHASVVATGCASGEQVA